MVEMITNYQLMQGLIRLFTLDPLLAFSPLKVCVCLCVCWRVRGVHVHVHVCVHGMMYVHMCLYDIVHVCTYVYLHEYSDMKMCVDKEI